MESRKWGAGAVSFYWFWSGTTNFSVSSFFSVVCLDFKLWIGILDTNSEQGAGNLTEIKRFTGPSADATKNLMGRGWHRNAEIFHFNWKRFKLMKRSFPNQGRSQVLLFFCLHPMSWWKVFLLIAWVIFKGSFPLKPFHDSCKEAREGAEKLLQDLIYHGFCYIMWGRRF